MKETIPQDIGPLLQGLLMVLVSISVVQIVCNRHKHLANIGLLVAGACLSFLKIGYTTALLPELGLMLLLFTVALSMTMDTFARMWKVIVVGGIAQMLLTALLAAVACTFAGMTFNHGLVIGFMLSMSSTAIVMGYVLSKKQLSESYAQVASGILAAQDISFLPLSVLLPLLAVNATSEHPQRHSPVIGVVVLIAFIFIGARVTRWAFKHTELFKNNSLFLGILGSICIGSGVLTSVIGLSPALGSFLGGLFVSQTEMRHDAKSSLNAWQILLGGIFFVSVGMFLDLDFLLQNAPSIMALALCVMFGKFLTGAIATLLLRYPLRDAIKVGGALSQVGELSFALAFTAKSLGLITDDVQKLFVAVAVLSMILTPLSIRGAFALAEVGRLKRYLGWRIPGLHFLGTADLPAKAPTNGKLVIVCGFGMVGGMCAKEAGKDHRVVIINKNPDTKERMNGMRNASLLIGDCTDPEILVEAGIEEAVLVVLAIDNDEAILAAVRKIREKNSTVPIEVRVQYYSHKFLGALGRLRGNPTVAEAVVGTHMARAVRQCLGPAPSSHAVSEPPSTVA